MESSWVSGSVFNSLRLVPQRTEGHVSPGPEEVDREDEGTRAPPPQILLPLEERVSHFRDMLLERGVRTRTPAWGSEVSDCHCPAAGARFLPQSSRVRSWQIRVSEHQDEEALLLVSGEDGEFGRVGAGQKALGEKREGLRAGPTQITSGKCLSVK